MMLKYGFNMNDEALCVENAVAKILKKNYRTEDILKKWNQKLIGTNKMGDLIAKEICSGRQKI